MSVRYLCVHCDETFIHEGSKKPRCPECMRVNGLERLSKAQTAGPERPPWLLWAVAGVGVAIAGGAYAYWAAESADTVSGDAPLAPLDRSAVLGHLRSHGVQARQLGTMLLPGDEVQSWAEEVAGGASGPQATAAALQQAIRERAGEGAFEAWSLGVPRETPITDSTQVLEWLGEDGAHHHLYPLEVATLMTVALRSVGVPAMVAEAIRFDGESTPPDPSGHYGYYLVAVFDGEPGEGDPTFYDPYVGREVQPMETRVLTDLEAIGAAMSSRALYLLSRESDPERAMEASGASLRLDGSSPTARAVRGAILLTAGRADEGLDELNAARQLRPDAPRRNLLAGVYMATGDLDSASREVAAALEEYPEFAPGRATLAAIHLSRGETDLARTELEAAERIDPQLHLLDQLWAGFYATTGEMDRAVQRAREAVENNGDIQTRLMAARIYRQASRYEMMRREAHAVLDRMPSSRRADMRTIIRRMLGPTALEPLDEDFDDEDFDDEDFDDEDFDDEDLDDEDLDDQDLGLSDPDFLELESPLLRGGGPSLGGGGGPSLLGNERLGGGGFQLGGGGGGGGLRLGGGDDLSLGQDE